MNSALYKAILFSLFFLWFAPFTVDAATLARPANNLGLVGYWTFDGADMVPNVRDRSGNANHGNLYGQTSTTTVLGKIGQALSFDGADDYVGMANSTVWDFSGPFSISVWIKRTGALNSFAGLVTRGTNDPYPWGLRFRSGILELYINSSAGSYSFTPALGEWYHVVALWNGTHTLIYIDGVEVSQIAQASGPTANDDPIYIGTDYIPGNDRHFPGVIDDVRLYNRALSVGEIKNLYNSAATKFSTSQSSSGLQNGLVGHWTFDGKDMTSNVKDASGLGNNGRLQGQVATTTVIGKIGQALSFDGVNDYTISPDPVIGSSFTFAAWIKPANNFGTSGAGVFDTKPSSVGAVRIFGHTGSPSQICFDIGGNIPNQCTSDTGYGISDWTNEWHHVALVLSGSDDTTLYVDGVNVGSVANSVSASSDTFVLGTYNDTNYFNGVIDDVRTYNRALSADEIKQLYAMGGSKINSVEPTAKGGLASGLVGHWTFDGADMVPNVRDRSGRGNHGNISGMTSTTTVIGKLGQALDFESSSSNYVSITDADSLDVTSAFTFAAWIKAESFTAVNNQANWIFGKDISGARSYDFGFYNTSGTINLTAQINGTNRGLSTASFTIDGLWHHVVATYDGSNVTYYIDGVTSGTVASVNPAVTSTDLAIGRRNFVGFNEYFDGSIDDVRIYNKTLSASEVKQLYNMGR